MDAEQLWETTMDPEKRILLRVTMDEAATSEIDLCNAGSYCWSLVLSL